MTLVADPTAELIAPLGSELRPAWRGRLHQLALVVFIPLLAALAAAADGTRATVGVVIYALGMCAMLAASAIFHRWVHSLAARRWWQRADHAMIYAAIAGSFTPICLLTVEGKWSTVMLTVMWVGALGGAIIKFTDWQHRRVVGGVLYIGLGWAGLAALPALWRHGGVPTALVVVGGLLYTGGATVLYLRRPRLHPTVFSYHELWHACTVLAALAHMGAVWMLIREVPGS